MKIGDVERTRIYESYQRHGERKYKGLKKRDFFRFEVELGIIDIISDEISNIEFIDSDEEYTVEDRKLEFAKMISSAVLAQVEVCKYCPGRCMEQPDMDAEGLFLGAENMDIDMEV
ncbi:MAG: hypothetical protein U9R21_04910 [Candidatus Thermoplasmatota archaeon]|nr:hypothetical protein [Candidatus Thermoplasmatota archaeon]